MHKNYASTLVKVLQRSRTIAYIMYSYVYGERERHLFLEMCDAVGGVDTPEICKASQQARNSGNS